MSMSPDQNKPGSTFPQDSSWAFDVKHGDPRVLLGRGTLFRVQMSSVNATVAWSFATLLLRVIPLWKQVDMFREYKARLAAHLGAAEAHAVVAGAVYAISIGTNDFIENYFALTTTRFLEFTLPEYTVYLVGLARAFLAELSGLGARRIGFTGLTAMGCLPLERARAAALGLGGGGGCDEGYNAAARGFNAALAAMVADMGGELPGADIRVAEVYDFFEGVVRDPARHGFARADVGCCGTRTYEMGYPCGAWAAAPGGTCPDADRYVFWDAVHPTERASMLVAEHLMNSTFGRFEGPSSWFIRISSSFV